MEVPPWKKGAEDARFAGDDKPNFRIRRAKIGHAAGW
jgi:hypothetical protein